jgi:hypothetical protein
VPLRLDGALFMTAEQLCIFCWCGPALVPLIAVIAIAVGVLLAAFWKASVSHRIRAVIDWWKEMRTMHDIRIGVTNGAWVRMGLRGDQCAYRSVVKDSEDDGLYDAYEDAYDSDEGSDAEEEQAAVDGGSSSTISSPGSAEKKPRGSLGRKQREQVLVNRAGAVVAEQVCTRLLLHGNNDESTMVPAEHKYADACQRLCARGILIRLHLATSTPRRPVTRECRLLYNAREEILYTSFNPSHTYSIHEVVSAVPVPQYNRSAFKIVFSTGTFLLQLLPPRPDATTAFATANRDIFVSNFVQFIRYKAVTALSGANAVV